MKTRATVTSITDPTHALIEVKRKSACSGCSSSHGKKCEHCELILGDDRIKCKVRNELGASVGDEVIIASESKGVIFNAFVVFLFPLLVCCIGSTVTYFITHSDKLCAVCFLLCLALSYTAVFIYSKLRVKQTDITITEIVKKNEE